MIERNHLTAMRLVTRRLERAGDDINQAQIAARQVDAITELELTRQEIFEKYGVPDPEPLPGELEPGFLNPQLLLDQILSALQVRSPLSVHEIRNITGFTYDKFTPLLKPYIDSGQVLFKRGATIGRNQYSWVDLNR